MRHLPDSGVLCNIKKRYLEDFIRFLFESGDKTEILLTRTHELGRAIVARVDNLKYPKHRDYKKGDVIFCIPKSDAGETFNFLYITRENEERINDEIESYFNRYFSEFCTTLRNIGVMQKRIVDIFICGHNINLDHITTDALIKKDYRFRANIMKTALSMAKDFNF